MSPRARRVKVLAGFQLEVEFANGEIKLFDTSPLLKFPVFQPLKSRSYFERAFVAQGIVQWPNEEDISPDLLYMDSRPASDRSQPF